MHWIEQIDLRLKENWEEQMFLWYQDTLDKEKLNEKAKEAREFLLDPDLLKKTKELLKGEKDLIRKRKAEILEKEISKAKIEYNEELFKLRSEIEETVDEFLPSIKGEKVKSRERSRILMKNMNRNLRKEAHYSWEQLLNDIERKARKTIKIANKLAQKEGFLNYPEFVLSFEDLSLDNLFQICSGIKKNTEGVWRDFVEKSKKDISNLQIYDLRFMLYKFFLPPDRYFPKEDLFPSLKSTLESFGVNLGALPIKLESRDKGPFSGACYTLKMGEDMRITYNPVGGYMDYRVLFHEFGHAMHYLYMPRSFLLADVQSFKEGMADIWSGFIDTKEWLQEFTSITEDEMDVFYSALALDEAFRFREFITELSFELELYTNPDADLGKVWQKVSKEYFHIDDDSGIWSEFVFSAPLYMKDYIFGKLIKNTTFRFFSAKFGSIIGNRVIVNFLIEKYYKPGNLIPWREKISKATGETI